MEDRLSAGLSPAIATKASPAAAGDRDGLGESLGRDIAALSALCSNTVSSGKAKQSLAPRDLASITTRRPGSNPTGNTGTLRGAPVFRPA
jgi:hypothetical protein